MMFVSSMPCRGRSPLIRASSLVVGSGVLIGPERIQVTVRSIARHSRELLPRDKPAASVQGDQLPDVASVAGDSKRLPVLDSIHDFPRPGPQVALRDLRVAHILTVALGATRCHRRSFGRACPRAEPYSSPLVSHTGSLRGVPR